MLIIQLIVLLQKKLASTQGCKVKNENFLLSSLQYFSQRYKLFSLHGDWDRGKARKCLGPACEEAALTCRFAREQSWRLRRPGSRTSLHFAPWTLGLSHSSPGSATRCIYLCEYVHSYFLNRNNFYFYCDFFFFTQRQIRIYLYQFLYIYLKLLTVV